MYSTWALPATNNAPSRVRARDPYGQSLTVDWDYAIGTVENHRRAAEKLAEGPLTYVDDKPARGYRFRG